jgi:hypothetical protein
MTDDLVHLIARLRRTALAPDLQDVEAAADAIVKLRADLAEAKRDMIRCHEAEVVANARIAEALARLSRRSGGIVSRHEDLRAILSGGSQGTAAESWTDPEPYIQVYSSEVYPPFSRRATSGGGSAYQPRTREQYDAEEGTHEPAQ